MIVEDLDLPMAMTMLLQRRCRKEHINGCQIAGIAGTTETIFYGNVFDNAGKLSGGSVRRYKL